MPKRQKPCQNHKLASRKAYTPNITIYDNAIFVSYLISCLPRENSFEV